MDIFPADILVFLFISTSISVNMLGKIETKHMNVVMNAT